MCVYSMVADKHYEKWTQPPYTIPPTIYPSLPTLPIPGVPLPGKPPQIAPLIPPPIKPIGRPLTQEEIDDLRDWLERAKEYDKRNNEPDCETDAKIERLKKLILELKPDADISFLDEEKK